MRSSSDIVDVEDGSGVVDELGPTAVLVGIFRVDEPPRCFWNSIVACEMLVVGRSCDNNRNR